MKAFILLMLLTVIPTSEVMGQGEYKIALAEKGPAFSIPTMVARDAVLYVAYRSFNWLRESNQLQVAAYDLKSGKELRHLALAVPSVHGARASEQLAISQDGRMLAYVEVGSPNLLLLLTTADLKEIRRASLPMSDAGAVFYGFDATDNLCFAYVSKDERHFMRMQPSDLTVSSDTHPVNAVKDSFEGFSWEPSSGRFWLPRRSPRGYQQFMEDGLPTGETLMYSGGYAQSGDPVSLAGKGLLAFYGQIAKGTVVSYLNHMSQQLDIPCVPSSYGNSNDAEYAGVLCTTSPDRLPERGGLDVQSSEFLLIKTGNPRVIWRHPMPGLGVGDRAYFRWASPVVYRSGNNIWIVAPTKSSNLVVYEIGQLD